MLNLNGDLTMKYFRFPILLFLFGVSVIRANEGLLAPDTPLEKVIDHYISKSWQEKNITPAKNCDDSVWLRRVTLDLNGRIPTLKEAQDFAKDTTANKRQLAIERLMKSDCYHRHLARDLDITLMAGQRSGLLDYLTKATAQNLSWEKIFKELILADDSDASKKGVSDFLKTRVKDLDRLTNDVSVAFFGINVSCAQCHDHPLVADWKQDHFYGMKSFFSRTYEVGDFLAEREYGVVKFLPNKGQEKQANFMFLTGKTVNPPGLTEPSKEELKKEKELLEKLKKNKERPPQAKFSTRALLIETALAGKEKEFFARNMVNRVWNRLFGFGLVMPLDQMHSENPPSHPELIDWLARDFSANGYDISRLVKGMVSSKLYGLSSRYEGGSVPVSKDFAFARLKPLLPMQMGVSLKISNQVVYTGDLEKKFEELERSGRGLADQFPIPGEDFQIGVTEALFFSNSARFASEAIPEGTDKLVHAMMALPSLEDRAEVAVWSVLSRQPSQDEKTVVAGYLKKHGPDSKDACKQVIWSLVSSPEFRFNY